MPASRGVVRGFAAVLVTLAACAAASGARAFTVRGKIVNGTTGKPVDAKVYAINPSSGMDEEQSVQSQNSSFELKGLDDKVPMYLLRVDYAGVSYNEPLQGTGDRDITVTVYETTTSWDGVVVRVPHIAAVRQGDSLIIEQLFEVENEASPLRTITGKDGYFRVYLPPEMAALTRCFVTTLSVPLDREPVATGEPGEHYIEYPIRPGVTRFGLSYELPYTEEKFQLNQKIFYDIGHLSLFAVDSHMGVTSSSHAIERQPDVHGMASWSLHGLKKGETLSILFEGGHDHGPQMAGGGTQGGGGGRVEVVPAVSEAPSLYLMLTLSLVLITLASVAMRGASDPLTNAGVLRAHYDLLITRLARLDDLRATGAISSDAHRAAREGLMNRLGVVAVQMRAHGGKAKADAHKPDPAPHAAKRTQAS